LGFGPARLIALDIAESPLHDLMLEFPSRVAASVVVPELVDITDEAAICGVFKRHEPEVVFHAAAVKHVPMLEAHPARAIQVNVVGTRIVAEAARGCAEAFVMISTDKAVKPRSVMGATKRIAERVVRGLAADPGGTRFVSVRFGNVLGSNGSVVPIFKRQIARGGPVTVTHPEMRRYFITIPEAVQLVLEAGTLGHGGEVFVLDMGQQVRIVDLAEDVIRLSGLRPGEDIKIEFTGVRPGEKLFEEWAMDAEVHAPTRHPQVFRLRSPEERLPHEAVATLQRLAVAAERHAIARQLSAVVLDFTPESVGASL
jgi:FlaA1/EpsC-like NDP-sugar epimerase